MCLYMCRHVKSWSVHELKLGNVPTYKCWAYFPFGSPVTSGSCTDITTGRLLCKSKFQQTIFFFFFVPLPNVLLYSLAAVEIYNIYEGTLFLPSLTHTYFFFPLVLRFIYLSLSLSLCLYLCAHIHGALWRYRTRLLRSHTADAICISRLSDSCGGALYLQEITLLEDKAALLNRRKRKMVK